MTTAGGKRPLFLLLENLRRVKTEMVLALLCGCGADVNKKNIKKIVKNNCGWGKVIIPFDCGWFFDEYLDANEYEILEKNPLEKK